MRPAWNHSTRLGFQFDLSMEDGSDTDSDDGGRRRNSKMLTEDEVHNIRKFLNDEDDARAAESHLSDRWEDIDPEERAMRSDAFWGRWMVCTPPDYSTREDGGQTAAVQKDQQQMQMEEWQKMQGQPLDSPNQPGLSLSPKATALLAKCAHPQSEPEKPKKTKKPK